MKRIAAFLIVFLAGVYLGMFVMVHVGRNLDKDDYESEVATGLTGIIITASQLRDHKNEKAIQDLDARITFGLSGLHQFHTKEGNATLAMRCAKAYYEAFGISATPENTAFLNSVTPLSRRELEAAEELDRTSIVSDDLKLRTKK